MSDQQAKLGAFGSSNSHTPAEQTDSKSSSSPDDEHTHSTHIADAGETTLPTENAAPPTCLSFSISGPVAHFRKVETSTTRLTYGVPPRTTISGLIAAILGYNRNAYYQLFEKKHSAISVEIEDPLRRINLALNHRTVDGDTIKKSGSNSDPLQIRQIEDENHQRVNHSVLRNPTYRINVWLSNEDAYSKLEDHLENGTAYYTPALGLSEYLATIEYHGKFEPTPLNSDKHPVDTIVPDAAGNVHQPDGATLVTERSPAIMERIETPLPNRRTTEFQTYYYRDDAGAIDTDTKNAAVVDSRTVLFS